MLTIDPSGRFVDITPTRLELVRADAKQWWRAYVKERGKKDGDVRGVLAAWCADEYRLGAGRACTAELGRALAKGWLGGPEHLAAEQGVHRGARPKTLAKWGYVS